MKPPTTFHEHWGASWTPSGQPAVFDAAMRELALAAWNAAVQSAAASLEMNRSEILLCAGEMTVGEMRTTQAVLNGRASTIRQLLAT